MSTAPRKRKLRPPVKYHGGKYYACDWIISHFPPHRVYVEPFGGGASVLLNKPPCDVEVYNDLGPRISRFFRVLRDHRAEFLGCLDLMPYSERDFRDAADNPPGASIVEMAVRDFIRWRQSFGGRGQSWSYSVRRSRRGMADVVSAWWSAVDDLPQIADRLLRVEISCLPALDVIRKFDAPDALIYCDPPYLHETRYKASRNIYEVEMSEADHLAMANALKRCKAAVILSGYDSRQYREWFKDWTLVKKTFPCHASGARKKKVKTECLWIKEARSR